MDKVIDYIKALVHLYGLVHKNKILEIYNLQNEDKIDDDTMMAIIKNKRQYLLDEHYVCIKDDYFVDLSIMALDNFDEELKAKEGKPFYIPGKEELLKYKEVTYFEVNKEYEKLLEYLKKMFWRRSKAEHICRELQSICESFRAMENLPILLDELKLRFKNAGQYEKLMSLLMELANNTRIRQNNGYTPNELSEIMGD
jgi:hypothetical protein